MITISEHTFFEKTLKNAVVVDLGACEGNFMKRVLEKIPVKKYIAIEANPKLYEILKKYESEKISVLHAVVTNESFPAKYMTFNVDPSSVFNSSGFWSDENWEQYEVKTITLKNIFNQFEISHIDLLKMDIEGAEWVILEEFGTTDFEKIDQITVEFHDFIKPEMRARTKDIVEKLKSFGYYHLYTGIKYMHNSKYYDSLFYKSGRLTIDEKLKAFFRPNKTYNPLKVKR